MVKVYALKVPTLLKQSTYYNLMQRISAEKREIISRFRKQEDGYRTLLADVIVRFIVCQTFRIKNGEIHFQYNDFGKPFVKQIPNFFFNVSHSGQWVVLATSDSRVGIDIEEISPIDIGIAKRFFSSEEYEDLANKPSETQLSYFYDLWTLKESYIKALGKGLSIPLDSFVIKKYTEENISLFEERDKSHSWFFKQYEIDKAYKFSICAEINKFSKELIILQTSNLQEI